MPSDEESPSDSLDPGWSPSYGDYTYEPVSGDETMSDGDYTYQTVGDGDYTYESVSGDEAMSDGDHTDEALNESTKGCSFQYNA